jgi:spoIIIJ-associated protein
MIKIEAVTLEDAFNDAATSLKCSVTELAIEVVQVPSSGFLGFFKKNAIIVATVKKDVQTQTQTPVVSEKELKIEESLEEKNSLEDTITPIEEPQEIEPSHNILNDTIMPTSFVSDQDEQDEDLASGWIIQLIMMMSMMKIFKKHHL